MSIEAISAVSGDQARADAAALSLAVARGQDVLGPDASPGEVEHAHAAVASAEAVLAQADAAVRADQAQAVSGGEAVTAPGGLLV